MYHCFICFRSLLAGQTYPSFHSHCLEISVPGTISPFTTFTLSRDFSSRDNLILHYLHFVSRFQFPGQSHCSLPSLCLKISVRGTISPFTTFTLSRDFSSRDNLILVYMIISLNGMESGFFSLNC
jgi:hypothetical protein